MEVLSNAAQLFGCAAFLFTLRIIRSQNIQRDRLGGFDAVNSGGENSARVACAFACRIKSVGVDALTVRAAFDSDRRRGARFDSG